MRSYRRAHPGLRRAPRRIAAYNAGSDGLDFDDDPLWLSYRASRDFISAAKPLTLEGMLAKARAAKAEAVGLDGSDSPEGTPAERWAWDLMNDLLALWDAEAL